MNESEWEDVAVGSSGGDEWEDVSFGAVGDPRPSWSDSAKFAGSSLVSGASKIADLGVTLNKYLNPTSSGPAWLDLFSGRQSEPQQTFKGITDKLVGAPSEYASGPVADIAQAALESSVFPAGGPVVNALTGVGSEVAHKIAPNSTWAPFIGGVTTALGASGIKNAVLRGTSYMRDLISPAAKLENAQRSAQEIIKSVADSDQTLRALKTAREADELGATLSRDETYLPQYQRTAELTQQPGLAALEETLRRSDPVVKESAAIQDIAREGARKKIFDAVSPGPLSDEMAGIVVREGLESNAQAASDVVGEFAKEAFKGGEQIVTSRIKANLTGRINELTKDGSKQLSPDFLKLYQNFRELPSQTDLKTLQNYRSAFGKWAGAGRSPTATTVDKQTAEIAGAMRESLDTAVDKAVKEGGLPANQVAAWQAMIESRKLKGELFDSGTVKNILRKDPFSTAERPIYNLDASEIGKKILKTPEDARQLVAALRGQQPSIEAARGTLLNHIWEKSTNAMTERINPTSFHRQLKLIEGVDKEILTSDQLKALKTIGDDLGSESKIKALAYQGSRGNSITSESQSALQLLQGAVKEGSKGMARRLIAKTPVIGRVMDALADVVVNPAERTALLNKELAKFILDPKAAEALLSKDLKRSTPYLQRFASDLVKAIPAATQNIEKEKIGGGIAESLFSPARATVNDPTSSLFTKKEKMSKDPEKVKEIEAKIDADPVDAAIYEIESGRNPLAKNPKSTASGAFQLLKSMQKSLGVKDPFDIEDNYIGYKKLRAENEARFGDDPELLYAAHYLGAPVLDKVLKKKDLTKAEELQVKYLEEKILPKFRSVYAKISGGSGLA